MTTSSRSPARRSPGRRLPSDSPALAFSRGTAPVCPPRDDHARGSLDGTAFSRRRGGQPRPGARDRRQHPPASRVYPVPIRNCEIEAQVARGNSTADSQLRNRGAGSPKKQQRRSPVETARPQVARGNSTPENSTVHPRGRGTDTVSLQSICELSSGRGAIHESCVGVDRISPRRRSSRLTRDL